VQLDEPVPKSPSWNAADRVAGPHGRLAGRLFTDPRHTAGDLLAMTSLLARERAVARTWTHGAPGPDITEWREGTCRHLLAVPSGDALVSATDVTAVGFFGRLRTGIDHALLFALERELAATFPAFVRHGFLSYFDIGPEHGRYGNLILFDAAGVPDAWHANPAHRRAAAVAPDHYRHIRLHECRIPGPFLGDGKLVLERTMYLDFVGERRWRAVRDYGGESPGQSRIHEVGAGTVGE